MVIKLDPPNKSWDDNIVLKNKLPIAIIGATGYTGVELARLLVNHPNVRIECLVARQNVGIPFSKIFPAFTGVLDKTCENLKIGPIAKKIKVAFLCLPHHDAMNVAAQFRSKGVKVIDLSADFRIKNASVYEEWYGPHSQKKLLTEAVYGMPELYREEIKKAKLVASPGCYPTSIILGLAPLATKKMILAKNIIADSKSGTSGAGRSAQVDTLFCEVNDSFKSYKTGNHRHTPEIEQELTGLYQEPVHILFSPHLVPMDRGILSTIYCEPTRLWDTSKLVAHYKKFYKREPFVKILPEGSFPTTKSVRGSNFIHIGVMFDNRTQKIVVVSAIDNLTKGASGQAIQAFNLMCGFKETTGLLGVGLTP